VARALLAQDNPVLVEARQHALEAQKRELGEAHVREMEARDAEHARQAILDMCDVLAIEVASERRARMEAMTGKELDALRSAIGKRRRWPEDP
jgi:DNA-binding IclR family transcriptional regulator